MIEVKELTKYYGSQLAVDKLSFRVEPGEIVGILGPNGAGKSTTMKMLTGFLAADGGQAVLAGFDIELEPIKVQKRLGYLPENAPLYPEMSVRGYLKFIGGIRELSGDKLNKSLDKVINDCALTEVAGKQNARLSKGYRQRVGLASVIIHDPPILILDEPTTGLDPTQIIEMRKLIKRLGKKKTVLLCSHILSEVQSTCDRVIILNHGRKIADGTPRELSSRISSKQRIRVTLKTDKTRAASFFKELADKVEYETVSEGVRCRLEVEAGAEKRQAIFQKAAKEQIILIELSWDPLSLEQTFISLLKKQD